MMRSLLEKYRAGRITDEQLVVESLHMLDPKKPGLVLGGLPDAILRRALCFAQTFEPGQMVTNYGVMPTADQVASARQWIESETHHRTIASV